MSARYKSQVKSPLLELAYFSTTSSGIFLWGSLYHDPSLPSLCLLLQLPNLFPGLIPGWTPPNPFATLSDQTYRYDHLNSSFPSNSHFFLFPIRWVNKQMQNAASVSPVIPAGQVGVRQYCCLLIAAFSYRKIGNEYNLRKVYFFFLPSDCLTSLFSIAKRFP